MLEVPVYFPFAYTGPKSRPSSKNEWSLCHLNAIVSSSFFSGSRASEKGVNSAGRSKEIAMISLILRERWAGIL